MVKLIYHGHSCWEIVSDTSRVLIDPFLTGNAQADVGPDAFDQLDAILLTHGHGDHVGDTVDIAKRTGALVVACNELAIWITKQGVQAHPMHLGGGRQFPFGHVKFTIAHHGSSGNDGEYLGNPAGIIFSVDGKRIYHSGDTALFLDMKLIAEMDGPFDAAMLPIGDNFTMGIDDAVKATEFINAAVHLPMHFGTFPVIEVDPNEFVSKVEAAGRKAAVMAPGDVHELA